MAEGSITNLNPLRARIEELDLPLEVGPVTRKDGSCFVGSMKQNMEQLRSEGLWNDVIPDDVEDIRAKIVQFMEENRGIWTRKRYNEVLKVWQRFIIEFIRVWKKAWGIRVHSRLRVRLRAKVCG